MKRTEIAMIILIASLSMLLTFTLMRSLLGDKIERSATVKEAVEISEQIEQPAKRVFNSKAINPTVEVCVQTDNDTMPVDDEEEATSAAADCATSTATEEASEETDPEVATEEEATEPEQNDNQ